MHPKIKISRFDPFKNKKGVFVPGVVPKNDDLYTQLERFRDGYYADIITNLRKLTDKEEISKFKTSNLPAFTFSVNIKNTRKTDNIRSHTGVLTVDIDQEGIEPYLQKRREGLSGYTIEDFRDDIGIIDQDVEESSVVFAGLSASGKGLCVMVKIDPELHDESFEALKWEFKHHYGVTIDAACRDKVRLRFCTYDKGAVINNWERVTQYKIPEEYTKEIQRKSDAVEANKRLKNTYESHNSAAEKILAQATRGMYGCMPGERHTTLLRTSRLLGGYVASGALDAGEARSTMITAATSIDWDEDINDIERAVDDGIRYGMDSPIEIELVPPGTEEHEKFIKLTEEQQEKRKAFYRVIYKANRAGMPLEKIDMDSLCEENDINLSEGKKLAKKIYEDNEDDFGYDKKALPLQVKITMQKIWSFRRNVINDELQWRKKGNRKWTTVKIEHVWGAVVEKMNKQISITSILEPVIENIAEKYDPMKEKFRDLVEKYDGETDYIGQLASHVTLVKHEDETDEDYTGRHAFFSEMLKKMLVRAVKCATIPEYVNRFVFVMASEKQNIGKSLFFRWLNPFSNSGYYTESDLQNNKDSTFAMSEVLIYNLEELSTISKRDVNDLKKQISMGNTQERKAYGRNREKVVRRCSFFGSTNRLDFLVDEINSRWLVFEIDHIDWQGYVANVKNTDVWGQAAFLALKKDYTPELDIDEAKERDAANKSFAQLGDEDEFLTRHYAVCKRNDIRAKFVTAGCVADAWRILYPSTNFGSMAITLRVGRALSRGGYISARRVIPGTRGQTKGFYVVPVNQDPGVTKSAFDYQIKEEGLNDDNDD